MQRFSTDDLPARDRLPYLHDHFSKYVIGLQFTPLAHSDFRIEIASLELAGGARLGSGAYSPLVGSRAGAQMGDGREDYLLTSCDCGYEISIEGGPPVALGPGDIGVVSLGTRWAFEVPRRSDFRGVTLERSRLVRLIPNLDVNAHYVLPRTAEAMPLYAGYADLLHSNPPQGDRARQLAAEHIYDLTALVLEKQVKGGGERNLGSIRSARLQMIKKDVLERLRDAELTIDAVARRQGVTPRYIQQLFETEGTTFSEFVRENRLALAFRSLGEPALLERTISAIAFDAGFHDLSNFNRVFRHRFGATPSDVRAEALRKRER